MGMIYGYETLNLTSDRERLRVCDPKVVFGAVSGRQDVPGLRLAGDFRYLSFRRT